MQDQNTTSQPEIQKVPFVEIQLTRGMIAFVDAIDLPLVIGKKWFAVKGDSSRGLWYAGTGKKSYR